MLQLVIKCNQFFFSFLFFPPSLFSFVLCSREQRKDLGTDAVITRLNGYIATDTGLALFSLASSICTT